MTQRPYVIDPMISAKEIAARVEQLTKVTGDAVLLTAQSVDALGFRPPGLIDRGSHALKGKSAVVHLYALPND